MELGGATGRRAPRGEVYAFCRCRRVHWRLKWTPQTSPQFCSAPRRRVPQGGGSPVRAGLLSPAHAAAQAALREIGHLAEALVGQTSGRPSAAKAALKLKLAPPYVELRQVLGRNAEARVAAETCHYGKAGSDQN